MALGLVHCVEPWPAKQAHRSPLDHLCASLHHLAASPHGLQVARFDAEFHGGVRRVIAEGIERPEELETLRTAGVSFGQGYLLARPGPVWPELDHEQESDAFVTRDAQSKRDAEDRVRLRRDLNAATTAANVTLGKTLPVIVAVPKENIIFFYQCLVYI